VGTVRSGGLVLVIGQLGWRWGKGASMPHRCIPNGLEAQLFSKWDLCIFQGSCDIANGHMHILAGSGRLVGKAACGLQRFLLV